MDLDATQVRLSPAATENPDLWRSSIDLVGRRVSSCMFPQFDTPGAGA
ncbi:MULTISPECIES: hypothetical protein [unclassified Streptomyces]|nr:MULTISPECIES: hypothetical protein [unclassified Streptomyces]